MSKVNNFVIKGDDANDLPPIRKVELVNRSYGVALLVNGVSVLSLNHHLKSVDLFGDDNNFEEKTGLKCDQLGFVEVTR